MNGRRVAPDAELITSGLKKQRLARRDWGKWLAILSHRASRLVVERGMLPIEGSRNYDPLRTTSDLQREKR